MPTPLQNLLDCLTALPPAGRRLVRALLDALAAPDQTERRLLDLLADHGLLLRSCRTLTEPCRPVARFLASEAVAVGDAVLLVSEPAPPQAASDLTDRLEVVTLSPVVSALAAGLRGPHGLAPTLAVDLASSLLLRACYQAAGLAGPRFVATSEGAARAAAAEALAIEPMT